jgi:hypothetical protein
MEAMLGIFVYSYLCYKLEKMLCLSYYLFCFLFNKTKEQAVEQFLPRSRRSMGCGRQEQGGRDPNYVYTGK